MKNLKRILALCLVVFTLGVVACVTVSAEEAIKVQVSHYNQEDVYSNASVIFTKAFLGEKTLGEVSAEYKSKWGEEIAAVDSEWNDKYTDHKFQSYFVIACDWDASKGAYVVQEADTGAAVSSYTCPLNGFLLAVHCDRDVPGEDAHNYPSTAFGESNLGKSGTGYYLSSGSWKSFVGSEIYLYNIDLEAGDSASAIKVSGTFNSKMSESGIKNGLVETYDGFATESYVTIGGQDSTATTAYFIPSNVAVDFSAVKALINKVGSMDEYDYSGSSWKALQDAINAHSVDDDSMDTAAMLAWKDEIQKAIDGLVSADDPNADNGEQGEAGGSSDTLNKGNKNGKDSSSTLTIVIIVVAVVVVLGVVFLVVAMSKKKGIPTPPTAPVEEKTDADKKTDDK